MTDNEWRIMEALWSNGPLTLGSLLDALSQAPVSPASSWSRNTLHTYLTRMAAKGMIQMDDGYPHRYEAALERQYYADAQRRALVDRVYQGSAGKLIAAFVKDGSLSESERSELRRMLDEMEV
ncbi:MAG: BlaI/MecI/CopY family transcriptional regulator [Oscillospiraceae bacterium]|nr:BlaI/MecI/CopY family transcriptional regulator [Oscillospiraceae bacterium]